MQDQRTGHGATGSSQPWCMLWGMLIYHEWIANNRQQLYKVLVPFDLGHGRLELMEAELIRWASG